MQICVFGAGGKTGVEVVKEAEKRGKKAIAFVHHLPKDSLFSSRVKVVEGDILNIIDVRNAIKGCSVVVSVIGHTKNSDPLVQTKGVENLIKVMEGEGIKRLISLTGTGVRNNGDRPSLIDIIANFLLKLVDFERVVDGIKHVEKLKNSKLDWTVLRVLKLTDSEANISSYSLSEGGPAELFTSRKKVAKILVDLIEDKKWIRKLPVVSG